MIQNISGMGSHAGPEPLRMAHEKIEKEGGLVPGEIEEFLKQKGAKAGSSEEQAILDKLFQIFHTHRVIHNGEPIARTSVEKKLRGNLDDLNEVYQEYFDMMNDQLNG